MLIHGPDKLGLWAAPPTTPQDGTAAPHQLDRPADDNPDELREVFDQFVGQTFYSQLLGAMRNSVRPAAYMHGGRAEKVFQSQLDQVLSEKMSEASAERFTGPMFDLFSMGRR